MDKLRTTLTLPAAAMKQAAMIAARRQITLSAVVAEALEDGLAIASRTRRAEDVLAAYISAFSGFTEEERLMLDGFDLVRELE